MPFGRYRIRNVTNELVVYGNAGPTNHLVSLVFPESEVQNPLVNSDSGRYFVQNEIGHKMLFKIRLNYRVIFILYPLLFIQISLSSLTFEFQYIKL